MLVDVRVGITDPAISMVLSIIGGGAKTERLQRGVYRIGHFSFEHEVKVKDEYPEFDGDFGCYGVCDGIENLLAKYDLEADPRNLVVAMTEVRREDQSPDGGWRWHKWGDYIGAHEPKCEYLYDEEGIDSVWCYHVYEVDPPQ